MKDYAWVTDTIFDVKLKELVNRDLKESNDPATLLFSIDANIYTLLAEYYNDDVLDALEKEREK